MKTDPDVENDIVTGTNDTKTDWFRMVAVAFAFLVLVGYAGFIAFLVGKVGTGSESWPRLTFLFTGVEAIVFSAVGFIFGREVNRSRAEKAEQSAKEADRDKKLAQQKELAAQLKQKETKMKSEQLAKEVLKKIQTPPSIPSLRGLAAKPFENPQGMSDLLGLALDIYPSFQFDESFAGKSIQRKDGKLNRVTGEIDSRPTSDNIRSKLVAPEIPLGKNLSDALEDVEPNNPY